MMTPMALVQAKLWVKTSTRLIAVTLMLLFLPSSSFMAGLVLDGIGISVT